MTRKKQHPPPDKPDKPDTTGRVVRKARLRSYREAITVDGGLFDVTAYAMPPTTPNVPTEHPAATVAGLRDVLALIVQCVLTEDADGRELARGVVDRMKKHTRTAPGEGGARCRRCDHWRVARLTWDTGKPPATCDKCLTDMLYSRAGFDRFMGYAFAFGGTEPKPPALADANVWEGPRHDELTPPTARDVVYSAVLLGVALEEATRTPAQLCFEFYEFGRLFERWRWHRLKPLAERGAKTHIGGNTDHQKDLEIQREERKEMDAEYRKLRKAGKTRRAAAFKVADNHGRSRQKTYRRYLPLDPK
jgi:hypothetical protein